MKFALIGSAPSSIGLGPYGDPSWKIWACSPGTYFMLPRCDAFFELHRWEPGIVGKAATQKPWFSPEYCMWMAQQPLVWMGEKVAEIPNSQRLPWEKLCERYGSYNFTSSLAWMFAMALEEIRAAKEAGSTEQHEIGMWGVDMAATEEYGYQRAGCQFFVQLAAEMGVRITVPPESDLMLPPPLYGIFESSHMMIKLTARRKELETRMAAAQSMARQAALDEMFFRGALDDVTYMTNTWIAHGTAQGAKFGEIFSAPQAEPPLIGEDQAPQLHVVGDKVG